LIDRRKEGRTHHIRLRRGAFVPAAEFMATFWGDALDALEQHLGESVDESTPLGE
jgi:hypothetical protein